MKLLLFTQKVDSRDTVLGFFHTWIVEFARRYEYVTVICLEEGEHSLPDNVRVLSLGKEKISEENRNSFSSKFSYVTKLYEYLRTIDGTYQSVFVHMNQEYVALAGLYWRMKGIPVYLWRNHPYGNMVTRFAVLISNKVFCTSNASFTARYAKTVIMPVGIDTSMYAPVSGKMRKKYSVCVVGRIAPVKHIERALEAVTQIVHSGGQVSLSIIGSPLPKDIEYYEALKKYSTDNNLGSYVNFIDAVTPDKLPEIYSGHEVCLNLTDEGSFDKTIVEATACGAIPVVTNKSFAQMLPDVCVAEKDSQAIARAVKQLLIAKTQIKIAKNLEGFVASHSMDSLFSKLDIEIDHV